MYIERKSLDRNITHAVVTYLANLCGDLEKKAGIRRAWVHFGSNRGATLGVQL